MNNANHTLARLTSQPMLFAEGREQELLAATQKIEEFLGSEQLAECLTTVASDDFWAFDPNGFMARYRPYIVKNGVLRVPVRGVLLNDFPYQLGGIATGYAYLTEVLKRGLADEDVKSIAYIVNSGGGTVAENFEFVEKVYAARDVKPSMAFVKDSAYSAAYNITAAAEKVHMTRSGGVGSIGVVIVHMEMSEAYSQMGININVIRSKERKMEGNHYEKLTEKARARFQAEVDRSDKEFAQLVARSRGLTEQAVHDTDALTFSHEEAIKIGLADEVGSFEDALTAFEAQITSTEGESTMADKNEAQTVTLADHETAVQSATVAGATAERERISAILALEEAQARPAAANLMIEMNVSAEDAKAKLAKLPEEKVQASESNDAQTEAKGAGAPAGMFTAAMKNTPNPNVGAEASDDDNDNGQQMSQGARIRALVHSHGTRGYRAPEQ